MSDNHLHLYFDISTGQPDANTPAPFLGARMLTAFSPAWQPQEGSTLAIMGSRVFVWLLERTGQLDLAAPAQFFLETESGEPHLLELQGVPTEAFPLTFAPPEPATAETAALVAGVRAEGFQVSGGLPWTFTALLLARRQCNAEIPLAVRLTTMIVAAAPAPIGIIKDSRPGQSGT